MLCGIPFFTFPIIFDQILNSKLIVEDWKIGWRVKQDVGMDNLVTRVEIARLVQKFMDLENDEVKEFRTRASEVQRVCQRAIAKGESSETSINAFIEDLSHCMVIEYKVTFLFCMIIKCLAFFFFFFFFWVKFTLILNLIVRFVHNQHELSRIHAFFFHFYLGLTIN